MSNTSDISMSLTDPSKFRINTQHFSPQDLSLFVESMETITRLTRQKEQRKYMEKLSKMTRVNSTTTVNSAVDVENEDDKYILENKKVSGSPNSEKSEYDETYFSAPTSNESSPRHSAIYKSRLYKNRQSTYSKSESEESGVFPIDSSQQDLYEPQTVNMKPTFKVANKSRSLSFKYRLLKMIKKKQTGKVPPVVLVSRRTIDENETLDMYEKEKQQMLKGELIQENEKLPLFSTLQMRKRAKMRFPKHRNSSPDCVLDKALRYLTL